MKKIVKIVVVLIASIITVLMIVSQSLFNNPISLISIPIWIVEARKGINEQKNKAIEIEEENRESNRILAENWVKDTYGATLSEVIKIEFSNRGQGWGTESIFHMESPFCTGSIFVDSETKKVEGGFNLQGKKFLHLYSEWVKKHVGIEDENVELGFSGNFDTPYIEFNKITSLSDDYREIFENTHNLFLDQIELKNKVDENDDFIDVFYNVKNNYYYKVVNLLGSPNKISLFVFFNDYRFIYNFPDEELASIRKDNKRIEIPSIK